MLNNSDLKIEKLNRNYRLIDKKLI